MTSVPKRQLKIALVGAGMFGGDVHLRAYADLQRMGIGPQLGRVGLDVGDRALDRADEVGDRDLLGRAGQPVAALGAAARTDQTGVLQLEQDVLEELQGDPLGVGESLALDRIAVVVGGELQGCSYRVVGLG